MLKKIDKCGQEVLCWSKRHFGNVRLELEKKRKELKQAERLSVRTGNSDRMRALESEINLLLDMEAQMWRQRSRILWMKDGDRNTKFFHSKASQQRRRNYITKLYDSTSRWCTRESQVNDTILGFYRELFTPALVKNQLCRFTYLVGCSNNKKFPTPNFLIGNNASSNSFPTKTYRLNTPTRLPFPLYTSIFMDLQR